MISTIRQGCWRTFADTSKVGGMYVGEGERRLEKRKTSTTNERSRRKTGRNWDGLGEYAFRATIRDRLRSVRPSRWAAERGGMAQQSLNGAGDGGRLTVAAIADCLYLQVYRLTCCCHRTAKKS